MKGTVWSSIESLPERGTTVDGPSRRGAPHTRGYRLPNAANVPLTRPSPEHAIVSVPVFLPSGVSSVAR
ncbi:MAG TPA: hypothetical protein K8U80_00975 [Collinsella ihuae]|uniref:Uncharacterized protein n=1 Tax=Collinsella ihumii TaxID=1720204 RepID=A0A921LQF9_9ACTN|nr:hypothetical protein [Collinsella ihumii]